MAITVAVTTDDGGAWGDIWKQIILPPKKKKNKKKKTNKQKHVLLFWINI